MRNDLGIKKTSLYLEIEYFINNADAPSYLKKSIDAVRNYGNFAAHPLNCLDSGMIVDVEPSEAEWSLEVIKLMFDYVFVQPMLLEEKRNMLNLKLKSLGKQEML